MLNHFPKIFAKRAVILYFLTLAAISIVFSKHMLKFQWMLFGTVEVCLFFYYAYFLPIKWSKSKPEIFVKRLFLTALTIRVIYVIFSYLYYQVMTGYPFEYRAADSSFYHNCAIWFLDIWNSSDYHDYHDFATKHISDVGYAIYLAILYFFTGKSIFIARIVKALMGAYTCVLIYKLAERNFGDNVGRMASIFCMIMPNMIFYCGLHLKEIEMTFLLMLFAERFDYAVRQKKNSLKSLIIALSAALVLLTFRTAVVVVAFMSAIVALFFSSSKVISVWKKVLISIIIIAGMSFSIGDTIYREATELWSQKDTNQKNSLEWRSERAGGNSLAKYASSAVFAPMIFTIPFPTMVETTGQENQRMIHGGNYVKNITSILTIFALVMLLISGDWRKHVFSLALMCGYLVVIAFSAFAQSERFHFPVLPLELMFAAYGISILKNKDKKMLSWWLVFIFIANIGWAWFKLKGRNLA